MKQRILSVLLSATLLLMIIPTAALAAEGDSFDESAYAAYLVPHTSDTTEGYTTDRPTSGSFTYYPGGWGLNNAVPNDSNMVTVEYDGVKQVVDGETRYYYKTVGMAVNAAQAGALNTGYYDETSNPNGAFVAGIGNEQYTQNDTLSTHIGEYTDKIVLLRDTDSGNLKALNSGNKNNGITGNESLWNFGLYNSGHGTTDREHTPYDTGENKYGICKGVIIDMNGHNSAVLSAGNIPNGQMLIVMNSTGSSTIGTGGDAADDESGSGYCTGTVVLSNITMNGALWASNHHYILLNGYYPTTKINKESANIAASRDAGEYELRGGYYKYDPTGSKFDIKLTEAHMESQDNQISGSSDWDNADYTYRVLKGGVQYTVTLDKNTEDEVKKDGSSYAGETLAKSYGEAIDLPTLNRSGYIFLGWAETDSATEAAYTTKLTADLTKGFGADVTLYAVWFKAPEYTITNSMTEEDEETNHGYLTIDKTTASIGETVTVTLHPSEGYQLKDGTLKATYIDKSEHILELTPGEGNTYTITMPLADITISAEFEEIPHTHDLTLVEGKEATETEAGYKEYYTCECGATFEDEAGETPIEDLDAWKAEGGAGYIAPIPHVHDLTLVEGKEPTETEAGYKEYYTCECGATFEDEAGETPIEDLDAWKAEGGAGYVAPVPHVHDLTLVEGKEATEVEAGYENYYVCEDCGAAFEDEAGETPIDDLDAWKAEGGAGYVAPISTETEPTTTETEPTTTETEPTTTETVPESPKTGDNSDAALWLALMALASMALTVCFRKKETE